LKDDAFQALSPEDQDRECVNHTAVNAHWLKKYAFRTLQHLVNTINEAFEIDDVAVSYPRVNEYTFPDKLRDPDFDLTPDDDAHVNGKYLHLLMGPMKTSESTMRKVLDYRREHAANESDYISPAALYVKDQLRFTISAADPMLAAMCIHGMLDLEGITVVAIKNKYLGDANMITGAGSPCILVNLLVELGSLPPLVFEVQVYIDAFLTLKNTAHKTYEFTRCKTPSELLHPILETHRPQASSTSTERSLRVPGTPTGACGSMRVSRLEAERSPRFFGHDSARDIERSPRFLGGDQTREVKPCLSFITV